jgi:membrane fusion protein, multidrug efflux system
MSKSIRIGRPRVVLAAAAVIIVLLVLGWHWLPESARAAGEAAAKPQAIAVETATAGRADVPVYFEGLGTVQAFYTVTVTSRVDGQIQKIGFVEGQAVKPGDLIAQIDPRPFQAALDLAIATKAKDTAQLAGARSDLERFQILAPQNLTSTQVLQEQQALVAQLAAQVTGDQANIENARTQLGYTTITAPIQGLTGIRRVDPGNIVHATDTTGIVTLTQVQPIACIFTLPEDALPALAGALGAGPVTVTALSRDDKTDLDRGTVALIDNQIDQTTGTIRVKATFPNPHHALWPGEFVNARVLVRTERKALTIPTAALQRGPQGTFTYVVKPDSTVEARPVRVVGGTSGALAVIAGGIRDGERVVTSNQYRLDPGVRVNSVAPASAPAADVAKD